MGTPVPFVAEPRHSYVLTSRVPLHRNVARASESESAGRRARAPLASLTVPTLARSWAQSAGSKLIVDALESLVGYSKWPRHDDQFNREWRKALAIPAVRDGETLAWGAGATKGSGGIRLPTAAPLRFPLREVRNPF